MNRRKIWLPLLLALALCASCLACRICYRYDNKYTAPRPQANMGVTRLDMDWYDGHPLFYLADGWSFYQDKLLTPEELPGQTPDAYFYVGRYGGFDLGDPNADPHGRGTYRAVVLLDGAPRQYALELTPISSRWRLWINGELVQSVGMGDENAPAPARTMVTFAASDRIEIVAAVADDDGYYSGMLYPPALGSPQAVGQVLSARLLLHGAAAALALALALVCLLAGSLLRFARPYRALSLLCLCLAGATAGPVFQAFGLDWTGSPGQRACYYGIFLALLWTVGRACELPRRVRRCAAGVGIAVCAAVLLQPLVPVTRAGALFAFSAALGWYKILTALFLLSAGAWALKKGKRGSAALLTGGVIFAGALLMDRLFPVYEPIYGGWFVELAGWALLPVIGGAALKDTVALYRQDAALRTELAVRSEHARLQQDYVRATRERLHESRSHLALISHYLDQGEQGKLRAYLDNLLRGAGGASHQYTGNPLVDAVLTDALARAEAAGTAVELDAPPLPAALPYGDADLTSLLLNLLDNALEAAARLPEAAGRWVLLRVEQEGGGLRISCVNAAPPPSEEATSKADKAAHGFGLPLLRRIAGAYGGSVAVDRGPDCCRVTITLYPEEVSV